MKILFSPEYKGHVFLGLNEERKHLMDTMVCDTIGLIGMLEMRMGIHVDEQPSHYRTVQYFKAMSEYMKANPGNALEASFILSGLSTAEQALRWRDSLKLDKWDFKSSSSESGRLNVLAGVERLFECPGMADRIDNILIYINKEKEGAFNDLQLILPCEISLLHPAVQQLIGAMMAHGAKTSITEWSRREANNNLSIVASLLQSASSGNTCLDTSDQSFLIYQFPDEKSANEYLALKGDELGADVWINGNNKSMDNWLRMMGKPTMGSVMSESAPPLLQLFVLGIDMMKEPLNIQSLISWLYAPMQPFGTYFGGILAEAIIAEGGYRNEKIQSIVAKYIAGEYTYHDPETEKDLSEIEIAKRNEKEQKEREQLVNTYLPTFDAQEEKMLDVVRLKTYLNSLSDWARSRSHLLRETPNNDGWCSQLESLAQMCDTFVLLLETAAISDKVESKQVDSWISTLYKGEAFMQYTAQAGSRELIDSPSKMAALSGQTIWMNFSGGESQHLDCSFLYPTEREQIKDMPRAWDEDKEICYHQQMQLLPFKMTDKQLILVVTERKDGEPTPLHPLMIRLKSQVKNLQDFIIRPNLLDEKTEDVRLIRNNNIRSLISFDHADKLKWPDHLSPTAISTLVEYPFDYMMERMLNIVSTGPSSIKDIKTTKGTVAHAVIESLFAPRKEEKNCKAEEITQRINIEFDEQVRRNIEACGAILYLPENRLEAELLKEQLRKCLDVLLEIIKDNRLAVTGCEHRVTKDMGLLPNDRGWDMIGFIDMTLEDENHHPVVFDFKWTSSKTYYRDLLIANRSTQLELYRTMLSAEKRDAVERTAYFLMPEGHLYSKEKFVGIHCTQLTPENQENIVEQLRQSFFYRQEQLKSGHVEVGEGFPISMLDYHKDTEEKNLFPLSTDETGAEKENIFSNYKLFK